MMKRKKSTRQRGNTTHGYGSMKKNRGAGHRAGRGNAGSGKRADAKKPSLLWKKGYKHVGKYGFKTRNKKPSTINLAFIEQKIDSYVNDKKASKEGELYSIDLPKLGYSKLLGTGKVKRKFKIKVPVASSKAKKKVEEAGGEIAK